MQERCGNSGGSQISDPQARCPPQSSETESAVPGVTQHSENHPSPVWPSYECRTEIMAAGARLGWILSAFTVRIARMATRQLTLYRAEIGPICI